MSPILVRPVREQLEHDRVIRLLQAKYKRKFEVAINPGHEQTAPVGPPPSPWYPDLVLHSTERGRRLAGIVEVETAESVNNLEAMSQWAAFAKQRAEFHLYVPASSIDVTRRLCADIGIDVTEIWAYHAVGDQLRFVLVQRAAGAPKPKPAAQDPGQAGQGCRGQAGAATARSGRRPPSRPQRRRQRTARRRSAAKRRREEQLRRRPPPRRRRPRRRRPAPPSRPPSPPGAASPVPFLRVIRDKRGYETTYLMHWFNEGGRQRSRILYAFRGPSLARVGRRAARTGHHAAHRGQLSGGGVRLEGRRRRAPGDRIGPRDPAPASTPRGEPAHAAGRSRAAAGGGRTPPAERPRQIPSALPPGTDEERMAFLAEWYPLVRERVERRTTDEVRRQALLSLADRLDPAAWGEGGATPDHFVAAAEALERLARVLTRRRRRSSKPPPGAGAGELGDLLATTRSRCA